MEPFAPEAYLYTFLSSDKIADYNDMFFEPQILLFLGFPKFTNPLTLSPPSVQIQSPI